MGRVRSVELARRRCLVTSLDKLNDLVSRANAGDIRHVVNAVKVLGEQESVASAVDKAIAEFDEPDDAPVVEPTVQ